MKVSKKIRDLRKQMNYSQQLFADRIGVSRSVLSQIEINKLKPSIDIIAKIAKEFNISISYFFDYEVNEESRNQQGIRVDEPEENYNKEKCPVCSQLFVINDIQKDVIHSLEKTISTQFQLIELLEKKIDSLDKERSAKQEKA